MRILFISLFFTLFVFGADIVVAQDTEKIAECDEDQEFIRGSWCPCPKDEAYASICGVVNNANIVGAVNSRGREIFSTRQPVGGVTISIYENEPKQEDYAGATFTSTGQPFGELSRKLVECYTSETEGKYFCPVRRLNRGNMAYVVFSCQGQVADIKIIPTTRSLVGINSDVNCFGPYEYTPLDDTLNYAERDSFLGCITVDEDEVNPGEANYNNVIPNVGFEEQEILYTETPVHEVDGDIRFTYYKPILALTKEHIGAYNQLDCLVRYRGDNVKRDFSVNDGDVYTPLNVFDATAVKCNLDIDSDGNGAMHDWDELTTPFRYDLPDYSDEDTYRVWETRKLLQREYQDPRGWLQYNHLMFGECAGYASLRYEGDESEVMPLSCEELVKCAEFSDPYRNIHTTQSIGSRLAPKIDYMDMVLTQERDPTDVLCRDYEGKYVGVGEDILISQCEPPVGGEVCTPGEEGCPYVMSTDKCYMPQFFIYSSRTMVKAKTDEVIGDSYARQAVRDENWELESTEEDLPHLSGGRQVYPNDDPTKGNSASSAVRVSSKQFSAVGDVMANRVVGKTDAIDETYDYSADITIWDAGGDIRSLCNVNNISDLFIPDTVAEKATLKGNEFQGDKDSHIGTEEDKSEIAGTSTYGPKRAILRDAVLDVNPGNAVASIVSELAEGTIYNFGAGEVIPDGLGNGFGRDAFDSALRMMSGGGSLDGSQLTLGSFLGDITQFLKLGVSRSGTGERNWKSFAHRVYGEVPEWNPDTPSYTRTSFCVTEEGFYDNFPPIGPISDIQMYGYPGDGLPGCVEWRDVESSASRTVVDVGLAELPIGSWNYDFGFCESWPGRPVDWPPSQTVTTLGSMTNMVTGLPYTDAWPGLAEEMRTCKVEKCHTMQLVRECEEKLYIDGCPELPTYCPVLVDDCFDVDGDGKIDSSIKEVDGDCNSDSGVDDDTVMSAEAIYACLIEQRDTWAIWGGKVWDYLYGDRDPKKDRYFPEDIDPNDPKDTRGDKFYACDLWNVSPLLDAGDIRSEQYARIIQEPISGESQRTSDAVSSTANYTALGLTSRVEDRKDQMKAAFNDYATTNDKFDTLRGGEKGTVHQSTAGVLAKGAGTGASGSLRDVVAHPERYRSLTEDFPEIEDEMWGCVPEVDGEWCELIPLPGNVDFDTLDPGNCAPNTDAYSCPVAGKVSPLFELLLGAAGNHAGVKGSMILAVIEMELAGGAAYDKWDFSKDSNILNWSNPWYARMPYCNDLYAGGQPPFGHIDTYFFNLVEQGGYHPDRENADGDPIVSKCNLLDAVYASAWALSASFGSPGDGICEPLDSQKVRDALSFYAGPNFSSEDVSASAVQVALGCQ